MSFHTRRLTKSGASGVFTDGGTDRFDPSTRALIARALG